MPLNNDERALYALAMTLIGNRKLPNVPPEHMWGGRGSGVSCALCGKQIEQAEVEYEVQDAADRVFHFHLRCHAIWQLALCPDRPTRATQ